MAGSARAGDACPECGALVPDGGTCRDNFHQLLFLESEVEGGPGKTTHFYAVASYGIQHPASMGYTIATVSGLREQLVAVLAGKGTTEDVRKHVGAKAREAGRITRRGDEPVPRWPIDEWPLTVAHVLEAGPKEYCRRVEEWAGSIAHLTEGILLVSE